MTVYIVVLIIVLVNHQLTNATIVTNEANILPSKVKNSKTGELYNDALLNPMIESLKQFLTTERDQRFNYVPNDVALVQTLSTLEETLFQLSAFYADRKAGINKRSVQSGLAIEFESQLCDNVYSSKFPREIKEDQPFRFYGDSVYYNVNCKMPIQNLRSKRHLELIDVDARKTEELKRKRRAITKQPSSCGEKKYEENEGNLTFPVDPMQNYTNNIICEWTIEVAENYAVQIFIPYIQMENDKLCKFDSLTFYDGPDSNSPLINTYCGEGFKAPVRSKRNFLTIKFFSDEKVTGKGFQVNWTVVEKFKEHPGFVLTSTIVVDQVGDFNIDKKYISQSQLNDIDFEIDPTFKLFLINPATCPAESDDITCYFETKPYIISKLIATGTSPNYILPENSIEIIFDHVIDKDFFPDLYKAPKYCVTWNSSIKNTDYGSWSRRNGKIIETNLEKTVCHFSLHGIHALAAAVPPPAIPPAFRFSLSWYAGLAFAIIWISITFVKLAQSQVNIPDWLNLNQLLSLMIFCCITLSGMHLEMHEQTCSILSFLLYYFGLGVFVWHLLKAAQFTGAFDKFFRRERNLYAFYGLLGWGVPFFIAGMAGGAKLFEREKSQSCWFALKGGTIWGYTSPTYFIVLAILYLYYKGLKKKNDRLEIFNYTVLRNRTIRDAIVLIMFVCTWITGIACVLNEHDFAPQFFFSLFLSLTVLSLCIAAKQKRRNFEKAYDYEDKDEKLEKFEKNKKFLEVEVNEEDEEIKTKLEKIYGEKWLSNPQPKKLELAIRINGLKDAKIVQSHDRFTLLVNQDKDNKWNSKYADGTDNMAYDENEVDECMYDDEDEIKLEHVPKTQQSDEDEDDDDTDLDDNEEDDEKEPSIGEKTDTHERNGSAEEDDDDDSGSNDDDDGDDDSDGDEENENNDGNHTDRKDEDEKDEGDESDKENEAEETQIESKFVSTDKNVLQNDQQNIQTDSTLRSVPQLQDASEIID